MVVYVVENGVDEQTNVVQSSKEFCTEMRLAEVNNLHSPSCSSWK